MDKSQIEDAFSFHTTSGEVVDSMNEVRRAAKELAFIILDEVPSCADRTAALRKLREVVMTVNQAIVLNGLI